MTLCSVAQMIDSVVFAPIFVLSYYQDLSSDPRSKFNYNKITLTIFITLKKMRLRKSNTRRRQEDTIGQHFDPPHPVRPLQAAIHRIRWSTATTQKKIYIKLGYGAIFSNKDVIFSNSKAVRSFFLVENAEVGYQKTLRDKGLIYVSKIYY